MRDDILIKRIGIRIYRIFSSIFLGKRFEVLRTISRPSIRFIRKNLKDNLIGVEIGVYSGQNSESILKTLNIKKLYLIDPFKYDKDSMEESMPKLAKAKKRFLKIIEKYKNKVVFFEKKSSEVFNEIPDDIDFIYIDGDHSYEYANKDIENYYPKLKEGGVLAGHDFYNGLCLEHDGVVRAVIEFIKKNNLKLYVQYPDWWVVKGKQNINENKRLIN